MFVQEKDFEDHYLPLSSPLLPGMCGIMLGALLQQEMAPLTGNYLCRGEAQTDRLLCILTPTPLK